VIVPFGPWLPDLPKFGNPGATIALNVRPHFNSYKPHPNLGTAIATALSARCRGAISVIGTDGNAYRFAGDASKLYYLTSGAFSDASVAGGYSLSAEENWEFAVFNNKIIAVNIGANVQGFTLGASTAFANLAVSTLMPKARHVGVVERFVMLGNVVESGTAYPNRLRWSAVDDETDYDQAAATMADYQDIQGDFGPIQRVVSGGEYGLILSQKGIHRATFVGPPEVFQVLLVEQNRGTIAPGSVVAWGSSIFFLDADGFYEWKGAGSVPISHGKVSQWFFDNWQETFRYRMSAAIDPVNSLVVWAFVSQDNTDVDPDPDKLLIYHWPSQRWSVAEVDVEVVFRGATSPVSIDDITASLDSLPYSLDSIALAGGVAKLGAFDTSHQFKFFDGANLAATMETARTQIVPGRRALTTGVRPLIDGGTVTAQVAATEKLNDAETYAATVGQELDGLIPIVASGRYHRFRGVIAAAGTWEHAQGLDVEAVDDGP
jgi:hypothetical protein